MLVVPLPPGTVGGCGHKSLQMRAEDILGEVFQGLGDGLQEAEKFLPAGDIGRGTQARGVH